MARKPGQLKAQDILMLVKLIDPANGAKRLVDLADELGVSQGELSFGLERLKAARLLHLEKRELLRHNALEFLVHSLKYLFPIQLGAVTRGIPTAHSAAPLKSKIRSQKEDMYVWAYADGEARGQSIEPLYSTAPEAATQDKNFYQVLALIDAIRIGRSREQSIARDLLTTIVLQEANNE